MYKLIVSDIDATLINSEFLIPDYNLEMIRRVREAGMERRGGIVRNSDESGDMPRSFPHSRRDEYVLPFLFERHFLFEKNAAGTQKFSHYE